MLRVLYPYEYVDSVFVIDYKKLHQNGFKAIIFDIDNTLVHHGDDSTEEVDQLFRYIQGIGFKTFILSNNSEARIQRFLRNIECDYIYDAQKPNTENYLKTIERLGVKKEEAVFIGDQVFTDIFGANKSGIPSILVKFIRQPGETKIGIRRNVEKVILKFYSWNKRCQNRLGGVQKKES